MNTNYVYFISSLPFLHFSSKPPLSFDEFILKCRDFSSPEDLDILKNLPQVKSSNKNIKLPLITKWLDFDTALRNELVKIRSTRKKIDASKYLRQSEYYSQAIIHIALAASRNPSIIEAEKLLDKERWNYLDELLFGHYFDLEFLIVYAYKLKILERWERINSLDKTAVLEKVVSL